MKKIVYSIIITILICPVPGKSYCQKACNNNFTNIAKAYLNHATKKYKLDTTATIFIASTTDLENDDFFFEITFTDTSFLIDLNYDNIYALESFKLVIPNDHDKSGKLSNLFKKRPYENINKGVTRYKDEGFQRWYFLMNSRCEIIQVNGLYPQKKFVETLKKYQIVFARNIKLRD